MMERARAEMEPLRNAGRRSCGGSGSTCPPADPHCRLAAALQPLARLLRCRGGSARSRREGRAFPASPRDAAVGRRARGTVALLSGCVQDRWFRDVNLATVRVLAAYRLAGGRPTRPRVLRRAAAHHGRLDTARPSPSATCARSRASTSSS